MPFIKKIPIFNDKKLEFNLPFFLRNFISKDYFIFSHQVHFKINHGKGFSGRYSENANYRTFFWKEPDVKLLINNELLINYL